MNTEEMVAACWIADQKVLVSAHLAAWLADREDQPGHDPLILDKAQQELADAKTERERAYIALRANTYKENFGAVLGSRGGNGSTNGDTDVNAHPLV